MHPSILVLSPSFLSHPYIPSFNSKDFSFTCILSTTVLSDTGISLLLFTHLLCLCQVVRILNCVMYVRQFSVLQLLLWASFRHFKERLPEGICCCLQTCNVDVVLVVMYCMYMPAFIVNSADISQLWVYLYYIA